MRHLTHLNYIDVVAREKSIRKAAEKLNITSTALNRRILALEDEVGTALFERLPSGVRLNTAGELFIQHIRSQMTDLSRVLSQISDLSGVRRGHVRLSVAPEIANDFLPEQIGLYRQQFEAVSFDVMTHTPSESLRALSQFEADIAIIFDSVLPSDVQIISTIKQTVIAFMRENHPLAGKARLRLQDCLHYPIMLPTNDGGLKTLLEVGQIQSSLSLHTTIQTNNAEFMTHYIEHEDIIGFNIPIAMNQNSAIRSNIVGIEMDQRDVPQGLVHIVQAKGRVLPVAAAKFMDQLVQTIHARFPDQTR